MQFREKSVKIQKIDFFAIKVLNIGNLSGFLHIKKGNDGPNIPCKFQLNSMYIFFKMADQNFREWQPPPLHPNFDGLPYPRLRWYPRIFFAKMTAKDELKGIKNPRVGFFLRFYATEKISLGGVVTTPPFGRRGLKLLKISIAVCQ